MEIVSRLILAVLTFTTLLACAPSAPGPPPSPPPTPSPSPPPSPSPSPVSPTPPTPPPPPAPPPGTTEPARDITGSLASGGLTRTYQAHIPARTAGRKLPLLIVLHGGSGTGAGVKALSSMNAVSDQNGFIVAYPDGEQQKWADGRNPSSVNDVAFLSSLVDRLVQDVGVDRTRVYASGISNGGFMSARLACEASNVFAAVAVVAATMPQNIVGDCKPPRVVPIMLIHGTADTFVPAAGGQVTVGDGGLILSTSETVTFWRNANGCSSVATSSLIDPVADATSVSLERYTNCASGTEVAFYKVQNGGHTWPGGLQYLPVAIIGPTSRDINASSVIWSFVLRFSRP